MFNFLTPSNPFTWLNYSYLCFAKPQMSSNGAFLYFANVCLLIAYVLLRFRHKKSLGSGFGCHYHGWGCSNFLWNIAVFCGHKKGWKHPQASVKISTCAYIVLAHPSLLLRADCCDTSLLYWDLMSDTTSRTLTSLCCSVKKFIQGGCHYSWWVIINKIIIYLLSK